MTSPVFVTKPSLPPLDEYLPYLQQIWRTGVLTNNGPLHQQLEVELARHLGVAHIALFNNATTALLTALQAMQISGEVITTPYSFVATAHSLLWNNLRPVFADIEPDSYNIDPERIEALITPQTTAIMPVHCYGTACQTDALADIARRHGLRLIYDAAHAFGVRHRGTSLLNHGDLSVLSFHATKVFNTFEGGAIVCHDAATKQRIAHLKNFGFTDEVTVVAAGINGKMNELQAAMGLAQLRHIDAHIARRRAVHERYIERLSHTQGLALPQIDPALTYNHAYFPVQVLADFGPTRDELYQHLREHQVYARRYFYPLISQMPMYRDLPSASPDRLPHAQRAAAQVLCLPIYSDLTLEQVDRICGLIQALKP